MSKKDKNLVGISDYLKNYKFGIFLYISVYVFAAIFSIFITLLFELYAYGAVVAAHYFC